MKNILKEINKELIQFKKDGDKGGVSILTLLKADLINNSKEKKPREELDVIKSFHKSLKKEIELYKSLNKDVLLLEDQLLVVEHFLPEEMSDKDLINFISMCFKVHDYDNCSMGEVIKKIKTATGSSKGKLIADEVRKHWSLK